MCLNDIEANSATCTDFLEQYRGLLTRLFFAYVATYKQKKLTKRIAQRFLKKHLQEIGLKLVPVAHKRFESNSEDDDSVISLDSRPSTPTPDLTRVILYIYIVTNNSKILQF